MSTVAWVYGCLPPLDWDAACEWQAGAGQRDLWNALVAIEERRRAGEDELYRGDPRLATIMDRLDAIDQRLAGIPRRAVTPEQQIERRALWIEQRDLWIKAKPLRAEVRRASADEFQRLRDERYAAVTAARQQSGLWWGNYNAVCAAFDVALTRLDPGEMVRRKREEDDGGARLTNQIQKGIAGASLMQAGHPQVQIGPMPAGHPLLQRGAGRKGMLRLLTVTVSSAGRGTRKSVSLPIVWHRDLPDGATVVGVVVQRRRLAATGSHRDRWQAIFTCRIPEVERSGQGGIAGIDIGWRLVPRQRPSLIPAVGERSIAAPIITDLRVATIAAEGTATEHILLPEEMLDRRKRLAEMQGYLDSAAPNQTRISLPPEWLARHPRFVRRSGRDWMSRDELRRTIRHGTDEWIGERRELYRVAAALIAEQYAVVAVDADIKSLALRRYAGSPELPPTVRRMRTWAGTHILVAEIARAVAARGGQILYAQGRTTQTCHRCGHVNTGIPEAWRADLIWRCQGCRRLWDQDENAARNLCAAAFGASGAVAITLAVKENKGLARVRMTRKRSARKTADNPLSETENAPTP